MARPTLKKGMSGKKGTELGEAILLWRLFLGKPELKPAAGTTVYDFGNLADKYTKEYQKSVGLKDDGVVGPVTWNTYDTRMAVAPAPVKAAAKAIETQGEANKAAAMAAAVAKPPAAPKPAAPKPPTPVAAKSPVATAAAAIAAAPTAKAKAQEAATQVKLMANTVAVKAKAVKDDMPMWQRILSVGLLGLGGLVGWKAIKK